MPTLRLSPWDGDLNFKLTFHYDATLFSLMQLSHLLKEVVVLFLHLVFTTQCRIFFYQFRAIAIRLFDIYVSCVFGV
jgi:hypothetical protein